MEVLKQVLGVDVAKDELVVSFGVIKDDFSKEIIQFNIFENNSKGFKLLIKWVHKIKLAAQPINVVMEATGVYHQKFAYFLLDQDCKLSIVLPNKISNYARSLDIKTVTDKTSSQAICYFGLDRNLDDWQKPDEDFRSLQQLSREKNQIIEQRVMCMNQLHAEKNEAYPHQKSLERLEERIKFLRDQEKEIKNDVKNILKDNKEIGEQVKLLCSIPGVGKETAVSVLSETNGFELIRNKKQLTSYAGLDVKEKLSGTSVKGKPRISKRGNKYLRRTMYFPALTAIRVEPKYNEMYVRLVTKSGIKLKGIMAVSRKILELMYVIHKTQKPYDREYEINRARLINEKCSILASS